MNEEVSKFGVYIPYKEAMFCKDWLNNEAFWMKSIGGFNKFGLWVLCEIGI